ncbi:hypothetical protein VB816_13125 [Limnoraphis robusta CCNP1324]|uniref:hypothetical protein n=1 Tax=Limnoraphis robusta TaxID=1118279 RepID=UPI002B2131AF|nr:hypothetical protein [Limnoraphis robusta]MEA5545923.1 hypothetical protein [Limnoraphis robusta CCNP1324]
MFGFRGGESPETVARKGGYMESARARWTFLTRFDVSVIKNHGQLVSIVRDRSSRTLDETRADVDAWMVGKDFEDRPAAAAAPGAGA